MASEVQFCRSAGSPSCRPFVLVDQAAEDVATSYPRCREVGHRSRGSVACVRRPQVPGPVRAMPVVMRDVLVQDCPQVPRPGDQHPVGALSPDGPHPALGISVAPQRQLRPIRVMGTAASG